MTRVTGSGLRRSWAGWCGPERAARARRVRYATKLQPVREGPRISVGMTLDERSASTEAERTPGLIARLTAGIRNGLREPERVLAAVLLTAFVARAVWLALPAGNLIFDEAFYVNAARVILGWNLSPDAHYAGAVAGLDPNQEHPPLGKLLMAASMAIFGDNGLGWRLPSVIAAMIALVALYKIVRATGESAWLGALAVGLFAFDNLALVHGRIGTLDMMVLAPILLGAWAALRGKWFTAGCLNGVGLLIKLTALYGLLALLVLVALVFLGALRSEHRIQRVHFRPLVSLLAGVILVGGAGLWVLDIGFTTFANPVDHVRHMLDYGANLTRTGGPPTDCISNDSTPWQWLVNDCEMRYLRIATSTMADGKVIATQASVDFRGAMNPVLLGALALAIPFAAWSAWRRRNRLAIWSLVWMGANYLPFIALVLIGNRITYIYYFLPVVPALSAATALLLLRSGLPRMVQWGYVIAYLIGFAAYFPFRQIP